MARYRTRRDPAPWKVGDLVEVTVPSGLAAELGTPARLVGTVAAVDAEALDLDAADGSGWCLPTAAVAIRPHVPAPEAGARWVRLADGGYLVAWPWDDRDDGLLWGAVKDAGAGWRVGPAAWEVPFSAGCTVLALVERHGFDADPATLARLRADRDAMLRFYGVGRALTEAAPPPRRRRNSWHKAA